MRKRTHLRLLRLLGRTALLVFLAGDKLGEPALEGAPDAVERGPLQLAAHPASLVALDALARDAAEHLLHLAQELLADARDALGVNQNRLAVLLGPRVLAELVERGGVPQLV